MARTGAVWIFVTLFGVWLAGQQPDLRFEVASIKANASEMPLGGGAGGGAIGRRGQRFMAVNATLKEIIRYAFDLEPFQRLEGGPGWLNDRYDITATIPEAQTSVESSRAMLRTLLAERFKLSVRREPREQPIFALVFARADSRLGPSLKPSSVECRASTDADSAATNQGSRVENLVKGSRPVCDMVYQPYRASIIGGARPIADLARALSRLPTVNAPVVDHTGLMGLYDFDLTYSPQPLSAAPEVAPPSGDGSRTSLFVALQEQLGLKLESGRAPTEVLVIESLQRPSDN